MLKALLRFKNNYIQDEKGELFPNRVNKLPQGEQNKVWKDFFGNAMMGATTGPVDSNAMMLNKLRMLSGEDRDIMGRFVQLIEKGRGRSNLEDVGRNSQKILEGLGLDPSIGNRGLASAFNRLIQMTDEAGIRPGIDGFRQIRLQK